MRLLSIFVAGFFTLQALAQVALTPATPAITPAPVFVPGGPAISTGGATVSPPATNATLTALSQSLVVLQMSLQQTLPILISFNDGFDFVNLASNGAGRRIADGAGVVAINFWRRCHDLMVTTGCDADRTRVDTCQVGWDVCPNARATTHTIAVPSSSAPTVSVK